ncbi:MAG: hypothetical protein HY343_05095 [Lentisphaerae bacterium]|nr:hypothetical protein [Lentisphaerota bacterium]
MARMDSAEAERIGTAAFYAKWKGVIDRHVPPSATSERREACMAWHAREAQRSGDTTLMAIGAAHETPIRRRLRTNDIPEAIGSAPAVKPEFRVFAVPPAAAFACLNWMQDLPYLTAAFWQNLLAGRLHFDRDAAVLAMLAEANERAGRPISPRQMANMVGAIRKMSATEGRWRVSLDSLAEKIKAFAGAGFADFLVNEIALSYPIPGPAAVPEVDVLPAHPIGHFLFNFELDEVYLIPDPPNQREKREGLPLWIRRTRLRSHSISAGEEARNDRLNCRIAAPAEERAAKWMDELTRTLAHRRMEDRICRQFPERLESWVALPRLDMARTFRARLQGDKTGYFQRNPFPAERERAPCPFCASVFLLQPIPPRPSRIGGYFVNPTKDVQADPRRSSDLVYATMYWFAERQQLEHSLTVSRKAILLRLLPLVVPSNDEAAVASMLAQVPPRKRCATPVWDDRHLTTRFKSPLELAIAGAIKWTMADHIVVVGTEAGEGIPSSVRAYADEQKVEIITLRRDDFPPCVLDRFAIDTEMPAETPFSGPPPGLNRFVRPLYGFPESIRNRVATRDGVTVAGQE